MAGKKGKSRPPADWEEGEEFDEFREFLSQAGIKIDELRKKKRKNKKKQPKNSKVPGEFTLEWFDTEPDRIDVRYLQGLIVGKKNWTALTLFRICKKLKVQPSEVFKGLTIDLDD